MTAPVLALGHLGNFDLAEKFLAILASLPHFAGPAAMCEQLRVDTLIESGLMLHAVEQCAGLADDLFLAVTGNRSEEHTSELQSLMRISYAVFCLKKKKNQ